LWTNKRTTKKQISFRSGSGCEIHLQRAPSSSAGPPDKAEPDWQGKVLPVQPVHSESQLKESEKKTCSAPTSKMAPDIIRTEFSQIATKREVTGMGHPQTPGRLAYPMDIPI